MNCDPIDTVTPIEQLRPSSESFRFPPHELCSTCMDLSNIQATLPRGSVYRTPKLSTVQSTRLCLALLLADMGHNQQVNFWKCPDASCAVVLHDLESGL